MPEYGGYNPYTSFGGKKKSKSKTTKPGTGGGYQHPKPKPKPKPDSNGGGGLGSKNDSDNKGPVGFNFPKKKIIPEIKKKPKEDIKLTGLMKYYSMIDPSAKFAINAANRGFSNWDERNAQQHLIWAALNPWGANIHEGLDIVQQGFKVDNQDIHNNNLRQEVLKRAREIDAKKGINTWYPSNDSVEKASFNMVTEQKENLQKGLMQDPNLPWVDTSKPMGDKTQMTPVFNYGAKAATIPDVVPTGIASPGPKIRKKLGKRPDGIWKTTKFPSTELSGEKSGGLDDATNTVIDKLEKGKDAIITKTGIPPEMVKKGEEIGKKIIKNEPLFEWGFEAPKGGEGKVTIDPLNQSGGVFINWTW
jgi:hypothetical protein